MEKETKQKKKMPIWLTIIIAIIIAIGVIYLLGAISSQEFNKKTEETAERIQKELQNTAILKQSEDEEEKARLVAIEYALSKMGNGYEYYDNSSGATSDGVYTIIVNVEEKIYRGSVWVGYFTIKVKDGYVISASYSER